MSTTMTNTQEDGLETIIVNHLRDVNGYVEGKSELYSKDEALVKSWLEAFLVATQPEKVARSMCFASASEKAKFYSRLCEALAKRGVDLTWGLYGAGKMMGIALVDHIIITEKSHYSFADNGRLCNKE